VKGIYQQRNIPFSPDRNEKESDIKDISDEFYEVQLMILEFT